MRVEGFFGGYQPAGGFDSIDLAVCTIEKANSIVNKLLEQDKLNDIGMIVIDEVHLISDPQRGYILELLLTKILFMCEKFGHKIQIVTMSATLPNVEVLQKWLRAEFFQTDYRPIELRETIKIGRNVFDRDMKLVRVFNDTRFTEFFPKDADEVCQLAMETIIENCQLIIFCPSKDWCEQLCTNLARGIHQMLKSKMLDDTIDKRKVANLLEQIKALPGGVDGSLQRCLGYACAFHHAGLTCDERDVIEM
jgi:DNA polymerase theta